MDDLTLIGRNIFKKEAAALVKMGDSLDESFPSAAKAIDACEGRVILTGMGKSGIVASKWASTFSSTGTPSYFVNPAEALHGDLGMIREKDILIALSFSGETEELEYIVRHSKNLKLHSIAVTSNPNSSLAKECSQLLAIPITEEACPLNLAPTSSTTAMMALGDALAVTLMQLSGFTEADFAKLHPGGSLGRRVWLRIEDIMHRESALPLVELNAPFEKILLEMTQKKLGLAVVTENRRLKGIITDGDLRRFFQSKQSKENATATDLMTAAPKTIGMNQLAMEGRKMMEENSIHHLVVLDPSDYVVGVLHQDDLLRAKVI